MQRLFFGFELIFCSCLFVSLLFFKKCSWEKWSVFFWKFDNLVYKFFYMPILPLTLFFIYRHDYSLSSVECKNKQFFRQIFPLIIFSIKPFLINTFNPQEVLNKWTGRYITEERTKNKKNNQILSLHKSLASFFTKRPI